MISSQFSALFWIIIIFIIIQYCIDFILNYLNQKSWLQPIPTLLEGIYDVKEYQKAQLYHSEKERLGLITSIVSILLTLILLFTKSFAYLYLYIEQITTHPILQNLLFFGTYAILSEVVSLPFELYSTFIIEQNYGFNKMSLKLFISDKLKSYLLGSIIGGLLLVAFIYFYTTAGINFWIYVWVLFGAFSIFMAMFYTSLIVPFFNKLSPLEDGSLKDSIQTFAQRVNFPLSNIFVIDGSKRSTKANAYFSGLGSKKTIVLYDTLIQNHSEDELLSILAHEVGHYQLKHIFKSIFISILQMGIILYLLAWAINQPQLTQAMGLIASTPVLPLGLIAFSLLFSPISTLTGVLMNVYSRKNEFEADAYAKKHIGTGVYLIESLKKLSKDNLSNLNPHPWYVFVHYSHPTLLYRIQRLL